MRVEKLSQSFTTDGMTLAGRECVVNWQGMTCEFRIEDGPFETKGGHRAGPVIAVKTLHRTLLDYLLNNDPLAYNSFEVGVPESLNQHLERVRDLETAVFLHDDRQGRGSIRMDSHLGMFQAHRLFSVDDFVDILGNKWVVQRYHGLGWMIGQPKQHVITHLHI